MWALGMEGWRKCETYRALHDSVDAVIRYEAEW